MFTCFWLWGLWCGQLSSAYQPPAQDSEAPRGLIQYSAQESALCQAQKAVGNTTRQGNTYAAHLVAMNGSLCALQIKEKLTREITQKLKVETGRLFLVLVYFRSKWSITDKYLMWGNSTACSHQLGRKAVRSSLMQPKARLWAQIQSERSS